MIRPGQTVKIKEITASEKEDEGCDIQHVFESDINKFYKTKNCVDRLQIKVTLDKLYSLQQIVLRTNQKLWLSISFVSGQDTLELAKNFLVEENSTQTGWRQKQILVQTQEHERKFKGNLLIFDFTSQKTEQIYINQISIEEAKQTERQSWQSRIAIQPKNNLQNKKKQILSIQGNNNSNANQKDKGGLQCILEKDQNQSHKKESFQITTEKFLNQYEKEIPPSSDQREVKDLTYKDKNQENIYSSECKIKQSNQSKQCLSVQSSKIQRSYIINDKKKVTTEVKPTWDHINFMQGRVICQSGLMESQRKLLKGYVDSMSGVYSEKYIEECSFIVIDKVENVKLPIQQIEQSQAPFIHISYFYTITRRRQLISIAE